ncbi:helix turn helix mercury resistance [Trichococcus palustris]|uniref:Helix turn helix mercury resistance n=1 Tax=Trichococcus palustris TaxID=140314 RepID=A0A143YVW7_9LACT|nr:MerR family transcriptional regulator [Trichococcus palustris]CZR00003.1 helix turn helix mercury resistance [Trichococcus palustris]SFL22591.1 DNA-binding transcriptional regulator, MerR family [Trichococcus palustris]
MNIAQVSKEKNITTDSLRYYERIGLIPPVSRTIRGVRDYTKEDLRWVDFVMCMRSAGLSIESLIEYVRLCGEGSPTVPARRDLLVDECDLLEKRILGLQGALAQLKEKVDGYEGMLKG